MASFISLFLAVLVGFASATEAGDTAGWVEYPVGELKLSLPPAGEWVITRKNNALIVVRRKNKPDGRVRMVEMVLAEPHRYGNNFSDWKDKEIAMSYREWEVRNLRAHEQAERYRLDKVETGDAIENSQKLYFLRFFQISSDPKKTGWLRVWQELYLVFPPDYSKKQMFYKLYINTICFDVECDNDELKTYSLSETLKSLRFE